MRTSQSYKPKNMAIFKSNLLQWAQRFDAAVWLDSNSHKGKYIRYNAILAVGAETQLSCQYFNAFEKLKNYYYATKDWIFGYLSYDLKNDIEYLYSENTDHLGFKDLFFFQPKKLFIFFDDTVEIKYLEPYQIEIPTDLSIINNPILIPQNTNASTPIKIRLKTSKDQYFEKVNALLAHIKRGDIYEANFCQEFYAKAAINPLECFENLNKISQAPFSCFVKLNTHYILCASPERYLFKEGAKVISQPIKGTAKRSKNKVKDALLAQSLAKDPKERSENIMIVDLVRNDLSKNALRGTVLVEELCKVYTYLQVHQMISTISAKIDKVTDLFEIIKNSFPMGSMTGAPKIAAMEIIETLEDSKRGVYSGSIGYISPTGNCDFNVVIRSILYNQKASYVSFSVGSAITAKSNPKNEYKECLLKAKAMRKVLER